MSSEHGTSPPLNTAHNFHIDDDDSMRVLGSIATSSIELILGAGAKHEESRQDARTCLSSVEN